jgi:hypothetical protein
MDRCFPDPVNPGAWMPKLRNEDFPMPKKIEDANWDEICATYRIPSEHNPRLRKRLDDLIDTFSSWMRKERMQPGRKSDEERIEEAHSHIQKAMVAINGLGPAGQMAFKYISPSLAPMLAAKWMNDTFPNDDWTPSRLSVPTESNEWREPLRTPIRAPKYFIEEHTLEARNQFVDHAPTKTTYAVLKTVAQGVMNVRRALDLHPRSLGGQNPLNFRHYLLINLIKMWDEIGKTPSSGPKSGCTAFCETVVVTIGWPSQGLASEMPKAVKHWRHLTRKFRQ